MNELKLLVSKLKKQAADIEARQSAALVAADAEGVSDDDRAKHLAEFDRLQAEKVKQRENLTRAEELLAHHSEPITQPIVSGPANLPTVTAGGPPRVPTTQRRRGPLKAFKGPDAELHAYQTGLWVAATFYGHEESRSRLAEHGIVSLRANGMAPLATLTGSNNSLGGYFVPDVMDTAIIRLTEEFGVIRRLAANVPMSSDTWTGPRWTTAMTAYWVGEGVAPTQSEPGWDQVSLVAKNLAAFGKMTVQLSEDAIINLGDEWTMAAAIAFAYAEDNAAFNGTGSSAFGGIVGLLTKITDAANAASLFTATGQTTLGALTLGSFWSVVGKFPNYPGADPRWLCHKEVYAASMGPLQTAAGGVTPADIAAGGIPRFLGYPVEFVNVMPKAASVTTGVTGILLADLALSSKFGDRRQRSLEVGRINDDLIKQLLTLFAASRVDILNHTIVDPKNSSSAGPVIGLKLG